MVFFEIAYFFFGAFSIPLYAVSIFYFSMFMFESVERAKDLNIMKDKYK